jgi:hypothetical protein
VGRRRRRMRMNNVRRPHGNSQRRLKRWPGRGPYRFGLTRPDLLRLVSRLVRKSCGAFYRTHVLLMLSIGRMDVVIVVVRVSVGVIGTRYARCN